MEIKKRYEVETISNSGLGALSISPKNYRNYKDRVEQTSEPFFDLGSAIHCKVLEPEEFDDRYIIMDVEDPSPMYKKYIKALFETRKPEGEEWTPLQENAWRVNAHGESGFKWSSEKVWENFNKDPKLKGYYDILVKSEGKVVLSKKDEEAIEACLKGIEAHTKASELLYGHLLSDCNNELEVIWQHPVAEFKDFKMKSIFDRLIINENTKTAILVDLKTTSKNVYSSFKYSYVKYDYHRQMGLYKLAVYDYLKSKGFDIFEWNVEIYIVATQTNGFGDTAVFQPVEEDLVAGQGQAEELLARMKFHFDNDVWEYPMEYYNNNGIMTIRIDENKSKV
jgi:hypothetical protein